MNEKELHHIRARTDQEIRVLLLKQSHEVEREGERFEHEGRILKARNEHEIASITLRNAATELESRRSRLAETFKPYQEALFKQAMDGRAVGHVALA